LRDAGAIVVDHFDDIATAVAAAIPGAVSHAV
jgi:hypothetical protein